MFNYIFHTQSSIPLYQQLYTYLKEDITNQKLQPNSKLPSKKKMQQFTSLSQSTIETAYEMLVMEGYIYALNRKGYFVCDILSIVLPLPMQLPKYEKEVSPIHYDFRSNNVDTTQFPYATFIKLQRKCMLQSQSLLGEGEGQGDYHLRKTIADYIARERGVICSPSSIIIGAGMEYLFQLLVLLLPEGEFGVESPGYRKAPFILNNLNKSYQLLPLDEMGLIPPTIDLQYLFLTPAHQYPSGICMPITRRKELIKWVSEKENRYLIEDDYDSEFRYVGRPIPALQSLAPQHIIYMNTFSRSLSPSLRQSYMVLPEPLMERFNQKMSFYASTVSRFEQETLACFIEGGYYARHIGRMKRYYKEKRDLMLAYISELFSDYEICGAEGGLHLCLKLASKLSEETVLNEALRKGLALTPYTANNEKGKLTLILGFANIRKEDMKDGLLLLKELLTTLD